MTDPRTAAIVLVAPRNPLNIGAAARAMSNFGFADLRLVNPYEVAFREARSAVGAAALLGSAREFPSVGPAVAEAALVVGTASRGHRDFRHSVYRLERGAREIRRAPGPVAILFGSEKFGLSNEDLSYCHWLLRIPTRAEHESMNLGQAVAVCLYELVRDGRAPRSVVKQGAPPASSEQLDRLDAALFDILAQSGYVEDRTAAGTQAKVRRLLRRLAIDRNDARVLQGMLRQILWKIG